MHIALNKQLNYKTEELISFYKISKYANFSDIFCIFHIHINIQNDENTNLDTFYF